MFRRKPNDGSTELDKLITATHLALDSYPPHAPEFTKTRAELAALYSIRDANNVSRRVSPDTAAVVLGNIGVAMIIVIVEQRAAMTSKAMGFIGKAVR